MPASAIVLAANGPLRAQKEQRAGRQFGDGAVHEVDLAGLLEAGGVFASTRDDREVFEAVTVDREFGTIE